MTATLIVRDEEANLPACLGALRTLAEVLSEVVVYDTGSLDDTVALAERLGARVERGWWDGDFARARNAAADMARTRWVLAVDADEEIVADAAAVDRALRERDVGLWHLTGRNIAADGDSLAEFTVPRLYDRTRGRWEGAVHEQVRPLLPGGRLITRALPASVMHLRHFGYRDASRRQLKARRNLRSAQLDVDRAMARNDVESLALGFLHLGRSQAVLGDHASAADALRRAWSLADPGSSTRKRAGDVLVGVLTEQAHYEDARSVVQALQDDGESATVTRWRLARLLQAMGRFEQAADLLRALSESALEAGGISVTDYLSARMRVATACGKDDEALACALQLVVRPDAPPDIPTRVLTMWGDQPPSTLATLLVTVHPAAARVTAERFRACGAHGERVAAALTDARGSAVQA